MSEQSMLASATPLLRVKQAYREVASTVCDVNTSVKQQSNQCILRLEYAADQLQNVLQVVLGCCVQDGVELNRLQPA